MSQIMQASLRQANGFDNPFIIVMNRVRGQVGTQAVREHKTGIHPSRPGPEPPFQLLALVSPEQLHDVWGRGNSAALAVLGLH